MSKKDENGYDIIYPEQSVGQTKIFEPTSIIASDHQTNAFWQLWYCKNTDSKTWRKLPSLTEAIREYGGEIEK